MLALALLALVGLALAKEYFPRDAPSLEGDFAMYPDLLSLFKVQLSANKEAVRRVLDNVRSTYLTPTVYDRIVSSISARNAMADAFEDIVPNAKYADYFILNSVVELASDSMLAAATSSEYTGTMLGYGETVNDAFTFARELYDDLQDLSYDIYFREGENSAYAATFVGSAGFNLIRVDGMGLVLTRVFDSSAEEFPPLANDADFRRAVESMAKELSESNSVLLSEKFATILFSMVKKAAPAEDVVSWILAGGNHNLAIPYFLALADTTTPTAMIVSTADKTYLRSIPGTGEEAEWRLIQSTQRYNFTNPKQSDFAMIQMERAFDETLAGPCTFSAFTNQLRSYPFRGTYTSYLAAAGKDTGSDRLQKCTSIIDAEGSIVACADPAPPENWAVIVISVLLMAGVIVLWVFGCRFAKKYDREMAAKTAGEPLASDYVKIDEEKKD